MCPTLLGAKLCAGRVTLSASSHPQSPRPVLRQQLWGDGTPPPPPSFPGRAGVGSESANERGATAHFAEGEIGVAWGPCLTFFMPQNRAMNTTPFKEQNCHQVSEWQSWDLHRVLPPLGPSPVGAAGAGFLLGLGLGAAGWGGARGQAGVPRAAASVLVLGWVRIPHRGHAIVQQR